jgi:hypothetical protein
MTWTTRNSKPKANWYEEKCRSLLKIKFVSSHGWNLASNSSRQKNGIY